MLLILGGSAGFGASAQGSRPDAFSLLAQAMRARNHQTYVARQETLFAAGPARTQWTRVVADIARDGRRSRMTYRFPPSVADLIVADNGSVVTHFQPSCHFFLSRPSSSEGVESEEELSLLRRNYRCRWQGQEQLEGHLSDRIAVQPRHGSGPWRICWIDRAHHLVRRTEEYDFAGHRQYLSSLTAIRFGAALPPSLFRLSLPPGTPLQSVSGAGNMPYARAWSVAGGTGHAPCWLPLGWQLLHCSAVVRPGGGTALRLRYGDGLKNLSVFEEAGTASLPPLPLQQKILGEQLGRYGQQAWMMEGGGVRMTVVGDAALSPAVGQEMLRSLLPENEDRLASALVRDFGDKAAFQGAALRRQGLSYEQIAARLLTRRPSVRSQDKARAWVEATLSAPKK